MSATLPASKSQIGMLPGHNWNIPSSLVPAPDCVWTLILLCNVALGVSGYLAHASLMVGDVAGCRGGQVWDCGHALHSRWSKFLDWPVSVLATGLYSVMLGFLFLIQWSTADKLRQVAWSVITVGAVCAGLAAIWFISLQAFALGRLCGYCMLAHTCGIALCVAILRRRPFGMRTTALLSGLSLLVVSVLIGGQLMAAPPESFQIERFSEESTTSDNTSDEPGSPQKRDVEVFEPF